MAKKITIKCECFSANKHKSGSTIVFAHDVSTTEKGPAARTMISVNIPDGKASNDFEVGKEYVITIEG